MTILLGVTFAHGPASAQQNQSGGGASPYAPNYFNRNTQPLSPYLNLLRGGNPAVNYFYGVQPGVMNGAFRSPLAGTSQSQPGRQTFFPQVDNLLDPENVSPLDGMKPSGHPVGFGNTLNYFGAGSAPGGMSAPRSPSGAGAAAPKTGMR